MLWTWNSPKRTSVCTGSAAAAAGIAWALVPAFAYHNTMGEHPQATGFGMTLSALSPFIVGAVVVMAGIWYWDRSKQAARSKRKKRRG